MNNKKWFLLLLLLLALRVLLLHFNIKFEPKSFYCLINFPGAKYSNMLDLLLLIFQIGLTIYFTYFLYTYEIDFSFFYIILRSNLKKWLIVKLVSILSYIIIYRLVFILLSSVYFIDKMSFNPISIIVSILFHISISLIVITIFNVIKRKDISILLDLIIIFLTFKFFNIYFLILMDLILIISNFYIIKNRKIFARDIT